MKCEQCGKETDNPVVEEIDGEKHFFCCRGCASGWKLAKGLEK